MKVKFGIDIRRALSGAALYIRIFQAATLLMAPFIFIASGHMKLITHYGIFSFLFELGATSLPRAEVLGLSFIYRSTGSEVIILFVSLFIALFWGVIAGKLIGPEHDKGVKWRKIIAALIVIDLVLRLIPLHYNLVFGLPMAILGFVIRLGCLLLILLDLKADKEALAGK